MYLFTAILVGLGCLWIIGGKPTEHEVQIQIQAPTATVFRCLIQPELRTQWVSQLGSSRLAENKTSENGTILDGIDLNGTNDSQREPIAPGTLFFSEYELDGKPTEIIEEVQLFEQDRLITLRHSVNNIQSTSIFKVSEANAQVQVTYQVIKTRDPIARFFFWKEPTDLPEIMLSELESLKRVAEALPKVAALNDQEPASN
jgi:hypothetical protein